MKYLTATAIFVAGELVGLLIFAVVKRTIGPPKTRKAPVLKGILERAVLFTGLLHGFPQILIAFGALKIGTRLHEDKEEDKETEISNDYFLVGNLISILLAMLYAIITKKLWGA